jgi:hypothetical protein
MLTKKQNLIETITGGSPDRFVNQFEFMEIIMESPYDIRTNPGETNKNKWGITFTWPEGQLGKFPLHDADHKVLKDISKWRDYVRAPEIETSDAAWAAAVAHANQVDRNDQYVAGIILPGIFENVHNLMGMEQAMMALCENPKEMHELIDYLADYEINYGKVLVEKIRPDCIFHHDDWGSQKSSFMSPAMFRNFFVPAYKKIYEFYKSNGVELIVHHSDSYGANLVPHMIDMGIDIWQGVLTTNNTPALIEKYGGQISFMGNIETAIVDLPDWTPAIAFRETEKACKECGKKYFIPCLTRGMSTSSFPGAYDAASEAIGLMSEAMFN